MTDTYRQKMISKWHDRIDDPRPISLKEWRQFTREVPEPEQFDEYIYLIQDSEGFFTHNPKTTDDMKIGDVGYYRAAITARVHHPGARITLGS